MDTVNPFELVIFGATGDLAARKLVPAMYHRFCAGQLPEEARIVALGRESLSLQEYIAAISEKAQATIGEEYFDAGQWQRFTSIIEYLKLDAACDVDFIALGEILQQVENRECVYYLSTAPSLFAEICQRLSKAGLIHQNSRVVLEKPLGNDLQSADRINASVESVFTEQQIFRIDHYLGKEPVQNLIALRFGNSIFEPLWNRGAVRDVQITLAEQLGVGSRGYFYDATGCLRDMLQNHLMQLLCLVAMEPPQDLAADSVRDEKLKVLQQLEPFNAETLKTHVIGAQYQAGEIEGIAVPAYLDEADISALSRTETFVAIKLAINNKRWKGVPFYLRSGKRMNQNLGQIVINFSQAPPVIYPAAGKTVNRLIIHLRSNKGIELQFMAKAAGDKNVLKPVVLKLSQGDENERELEAYERLLMDVLRADQTLFVRRDESNAAWKWLDPVLQSWKLTTFKPEPYRAGSNGPAAAARLMTDPNHHWV